MPTFERTRRVSPSHAPRRPLCTPAAGWLLALIASPVASPGWAQTAPLPSMATVVVTGQAIRDGQQTPNLATGLAGSTLDLPFSSNSVLAERVREQAGISLQDALRNIPGAQADSGFNGAHTQFFILRGAVTDSGTGSNRLLRDGVRLSNYPYVPAFVDSVDVLRGPGAAIGVRSEPGGTVSLATRQPQLANFGSVHLRAGTAQARELSADLNRVLSSEGRVAARVMLTRSEASQWRHVSDTLDGVNLGLSQGEGTPLRLRASFEATNQRYQPDYGLPSIGDRVVDVPSDRQLGEPFGDSTTNNRIGSLQADWALSPDTRAQLAYTHLDARSTSIKNLLFGAPLAGQPLGTWARVSSWEPGTQRRIDSWALSGTHRASWGGLQHQIYAGIDLYDETLNQPTRSVPAATSPAINVYNPVYGRVSAPANAEQLPVSLTTQDLRALGASLQDQIDLGMWSLVAGVRLDRQHFLYGTTGTQAVDESRVSRKLAVLHRLSTRDTLYANLSSGTSPNQVSSSSNQSLPSRRAAQAEVGWKALWRGGRLVSELAAYRLNQRNMISSDLSTPANTFDFTVNGAARSQGLEASLNGALTSQLDVAFSYAYTDAAFLQNAVYGGKRVPNVARHALNLWANLQWSAGLKTGLGVQALGRRWADEANTVTLPGYARVDLVQAWTLALPAGQTLDLQLALRNAFDQRWQVSSHLHVSRWGTPGQGRNAAVSATYRF